MGMRIIDSMLVQTAVVWKNPSPDGYGKYTYDSPTEISVRWQDKQELYRNEAGEQVPSEAVVFVGEDLDVGDILYYGEISDMDSSGVNPEDTGHRIKSWEKIPTLDGTQFVRKCYL